MTSALIALLLLLLASSKASAASPRDLGWISIELDPITTAMGAKNLLVNIAPPKLSNWSLTGIAFAADFPGWVDNILSYRNRDEEFNSRINLSPGASVDYYIENERSGWHTGLLMFLWRYEVTRNNDRARFINHIVMPRVGYRWFPFETVDVYLDPFAGVMFEYNVDGNNQVDGSTVRPTPIVPFATIHAGYHF